MSLVPAKVRASHSVVAVSNWILLLYYVAIFCSYAVMFCSHILQSYSVEGFFCSTMLQHTGRFGQGFLSTEWSDNTGAVPIPPNLDPAKFYQFPRQKSKLKGQRFCDATDMIKNATEELKRLLQNGFQECFQHICSRWKKWIFAQGEILKEIQLKYLYCSLFLKNEEILGTLQSYRVLCGYVLLSYSEVLCSYYSL